MRLRIFLTISFFIFFVLLFYYGFKPFSYSFNYNDVNTHYETISDLRSGLEVALGQAVHEFILPSGLTVKLTIDADLQNVINNIFVKYDLPVGVFVAVEPQSGKVLAMSGYSRQDGIIIKPGLLAQYPAASLIKIVTAAAALEELKFFPETKISYRSSLYKVSTLDLKTPESRKYPRMTLTEALAKSANNVFGKLTAKYLGRERFVQYLENFYFFKKIPFDLNVEESYAYVPKNKLELARTGAGFGKVMISPIHAAMMGASIANKGAMMRPYFIESIKDRKNNLIYSAQKQLLLETVKPHTAKTLVKMMAKTPVLGTMRKAFSKRKWRYFVKKFDVAGKTGSITWGPPKLRYEWSLGMAPASNPSICFVSLTGNKDLWYIKSTYVAREALAAFFNYEYKKNIKKQKRRRRKSN